MAVLRLNPCDPLWRPANYPSIWLRPAALGLDHSATTWLGVAVAVVFSGALVCALRPQDLREASISATAVCAPAVMLGVNRGNVDLLLFAIVAAAVALLPVAATAAALLVLAAAVLKLFPIFSAATLLRARRNGLLLLTAVAGLFGAWVWHTWSEISLIRRVVPQRIRYSYGNDVLGSDLAKHLPGGHGAYALALLIVTAAGIAALVLVGQRRGWPVYGQATTPFSEAAFVAGVAVFVGTFLIAHNYDYRLAFLLLTVPQLAAWSRAGAHLATTALVLLLTSLWLIQGKPLVVGLVAQQALVAVLLSLLTLKLVQNEQPITNLAFSIRPSNKASTIRQRKAELRAQFPVVQPALLRRVDAPARRGS